MNEYEIRQRDHFLRRNNNVARWLARTLECETTLEAVDNESGLDIVGLVYRGWVISLDYLNIEDERHFSWTGKNGDTSISRRCRCTTHLLNSIRKHCSADTHHNQKVADDVIPNER